LLLRRHPICVRFGPPIRPLPGEHRNETMARVQKWFDAQEGGASAAPAPSANGPAAQERPVAAVGSH
jgi:hypothetical protein